MTNKINDEKTSRIIATRLSELRKQKKYSQKYVANKFNCSVYKVSRDEKSGQNVSLEDAKKYAEIYDCNYKFILGQARIKETKNQQIGKRLKDLREENNLKQLNVAKDLNVTEQAISEDERGKNDIKNDIVKVENYAQLYNVSVEYILCETDLKEPNTSLSFAKNNNYSLSAKKIIEIIELISGNKVRFHYQLLFPSEEYKKEVIRYNKKALNEAMEFMQSQKRSSEEIEQFKENYNLTFRSHITTIDKIKYFNLEPVCKIEHDNITSEAVLTGVDINGGYVSYGVFIHFLDTIMSLIDSTIENFHDYSESTNEIFSYNGAIESIIKASNEIDLNDKDYKIKFIQQTYHELSFQKDLNQKYRESKKKRNK